MTSEKTREKQLDRIIFFSDAVFAIAMTLLALEMRLPSSLQAVTDQDLLSALKALTPVLMSYVISFAVLAIYWMAHHRLFGKVRGYDTPMVWLNMLFLGFVALVPFPTSVLNDFGHLPISVALYSGTIAGTGFSLFLLWRYVVAHGLVVEGLDESSERLITYKMLWPPIVFLLSIPIAYLVNSNIAMYSWLLIPASDPVLDRVFGKPTEPGSAEGDTGSGEAA